MRELGETERACADAPFHCCQIGFCSIYLVYAHSVADEIEHILGFAVLRHGGYAE